MNKKPYTIPERQHAPFRGYKSRERLNLEEIHRIASTAYLSEADKDEALNLISELCAEMLK